ncbi:hypothetical protein SPRG_19876 [Saprolegnia parasitica CBS 223.65]|uniref:HAUS augmin-like complex subunit 4 n=1 Tax=Saprolegnia parasitica (strain CBS 223.65) TaxID=695850 RepID=A0A067CFG3_SAPPC|nr:hypothetical protein SPRG_19876 [Saprolegnia parasitica CBS 223.65]KDO29203.1 hypothetical protein SPRG_19876 [Saprolegnia parasitica CBS 223.65]|eukprot:XP_012200103.1 hypothetical protein SPRG_19876 [Saprolegnia parasitica CBS 223.65]
MALSPEEDRYFGSKLLFHEVQTLLLMTPEVDATPDDKDALTIARKLFAVGEAQQYLTLQLSMTPTSEPALLGLTPHAIRAAWGLRDPDHVDSLRERIRASLLPDVERRIKDKCRLLCDVTSPLQGDTPSLPFAFAEQLPEALSALQAASSALEKELLALEEAHDARVQELGALVEAMGTLLLRTIRVRDQSPFVTKKIACLEAYISAMHEKTALLTKQMLTETYTERKLHALRAVRHELEGRYASAQQAQNELHARLQQYELLGSAFAATADQYAVVQRKIAEKETWIASLDL